MDFWCQNVENLPEVRQNPLDNNTTGKNFSAAEYRRIPYLLLPERMPKYAYLFKDEAQHRQYLFVDGLASGESNSAQLVRDVQTGELVVRKVLKRPFPGPLPPPTLDKEVEIIQLIRSFAIRSHLSFPRFAHLISSQDVALRSGKEAGDRGIKYTRVSYWKLYNGGTVADIIQPQVEWMEMSRERPIPYALVARFIKQTCETLQLMYYGSRDQIIFHRDLHSGNIFIHWETGLDSNGDGELALPDFYIGDFGNSEAVSLSPGLLEHPWDIDIRSLLSVIVGLAIRAGLELSKDGRLAAREGNKRGVLICRLVHSMAELNEEYMRRRTWPTLGDILGELEASDQRHGRTTRQTSNFITDVLRYTSEVVIRPLDLSEVINEATELERLFTTPGKLDERGTEAYHDFCRRGREKAKALVAKEPYIFELELIPDRRELGSWRVVNGSVLGGNFDIPSPWFVARLLEDDDVDKDGDECQGGTKGRLPCFIVGDESGYTAGPSLLDWKEPFSGPAPRARRNTKGRLPTELFGVAHVQ
ncbi:hypothetical protein V8F20_003246 [Naviculisporaceae sp. PSN 640]